MQILREELVSDDQRVKLAAPVVDNGHGGNGHGGADDSGADDSGADDSGAEDSADHASNDPHTPPEQRAS